MNNDKPGTLKIDGRDYRILRRLLRDFVDTCDQQIIKLSERRQSGAVRSTLSRTESERAAAKLMLQRMGVPEA